MKVLDPNTTMIPPEVTTTPSNCTDMKPQQKCKGWADKVSSRVLDVWSKDKCKMSLKKWLNKLSEVETCNDVNTRSLDAELGSSDNNELVPKNTTESCKDTWPKRKCKRSIKKINKRFNKLAKKCSKTAEELKKSFLLLQDDGHFDC